MVLNMPIHFDRVIPYTLYHENNNYRAMKPAVNEHDGAGLTRNGLTTRYDSKYFPVGKTIDELTLQEMIDIYHRIYWNPKYDDIKSYKIAARMFDFGVNKPAYAVEGLQQALCNIGICVKIDCHFGPQTLAAVNAADPDALYNEYVRLIAIYYHTLPSFDRNGPGWLNRLHDDIEKFNK